jgi:hypothetical protein
VAGGTCSRHTEADAVSNQDTDFEIEDSILLPGRRVSPHTRLATAVLELALRDADRGDITAQRFLLGDGTLGFWCEMGGLDPVAVSEQCRRRWSSAATSTNAT